MKKKLINKKLIIIILSILLSLLFIWHQNNVLQINDVNYRNKKLPSSFEGYKILQISDLHSKYFGKDQSRLVEKTRKINPDMIVLTGDLVDRNRTDISAVISYVKQIDTHIPIFFVGGNHDVVVKDYDELLKKLQDEGVKILNDSADVVKINNQKIAVLGVEDPYKLLLGKSKYHEGYATIDFYERLEKLCVKKTDDFTILLSHRPELYDFYIENNIDLVFTGHAHGGQIRIFQRGLFAPHQGILPIYSSGVFEDKGTTMIVNRGLGNSLFPVRIFNRPELVCVTLNK